MTTSRSLITILLLLLAPVSLLVAMAVGSIDYSLEQLFNSLFEQASATRHDILWQLRWPRAASAFATVQARPGSRRRVLHYRIYALLMAR